MTGSQNPIEYGVDMSREPSRPDYRLPRAAKWAIPRAVADSGGGTISFRKSH